jgi:hypothetical protein
VKKNIAALKSMSVPPKNPVGGDPERRCITTYVGYRVGGE